MIYYLMIGNNEKEYRALNITKSSIFNRIKTTFTKEGGCRTLKGIDEFTTLFPNEDELRRHLLEEGILGPDDYKKHITIRGKKKGECKKVPLDIFYEEDRAYIQNPKALIDYINSKLISNDNPDYAYVERLTKLFLKNKEYAATASHILYLLNNDKNQFIRIGEDNLFIGLVKQYIYEEPKYYEQLDKPVVRYYRLHAVLADVNKHDKDNGMKKPSIVSLEPHRVSFAEANKIIDDIEERFFAEDWEFIKAFASRFFGNKLCSSTVAEVLDYANYNPYKLRMQDEHKDNMVRRLAKLLTMNYQQAASGRITYTGKINESGFYSVLDFLKQYEEEERKGQSKGESESLTTFDWKKRTRKVKNLPGQKGMFE